MRGLKILLLILFCIIRLFSVSFAGTEIEWGEKRLPELEGNQRINAQKQLLMFDVIETMPDLSIMNVYYATVSNNTIIVWLEEKDSRFSYFLLFDQGGCFIRGYKMVFNKTNGFLRLSVAEDQLRIYRSNMRTVFCFSKDNVKYYYASPDDVNYYHNYREPSDIQISYDDYSVVIVNKEEDNQVIISIPHHKVLQKKQFPIFGVLACVLCFVLIFRSSYRHK